MWRLGLADLRYRKRRFVIAVLAASLAFGLSLLLSGTVTHLQRESDRIVALFGADRFVVAQGGTGPFTTTRLLRGGMASELALRPGVQRADPLVQARDNVDDLDVNVLGLAPGGLGWPEVTDGRLAEQPGEAVVDGTLGYDPGDRLRLGQLELSVVGTSSNTTYYFGMPTVFAPLTDVQRGFLSGQDFITAVAISGDLSDPPPGTRVMDEADVVDDLNWPQKAGLQTVQIINGLLWAMAAGVVASMVYLSVLEGSREIAVQKAVGVTDRSLYAGLALQGVALAVLACLGGAVVNRLLAPIMPFAVETTLGAHLVVVAVGVVVGLLAALIGLRRATSIDPALAFGR